jgi:nitrite reductase/ring-hydroxylating ferredoxin subunit
MDKFIKIGQASDIAEGNMICVDVAGQAVAIIRQGDKYFAVHDTCTHAYASLSEGVIEGEEIECPLHGARFNFKTGKATSAPAIEDLKTYEVRLSGNDLEIKIKA